MNEVEIMVTDDNGKEIPAMMATCESCNEYSFMVFIVEGMEHSHLQCIGCGLSYCPGAYCEKQKRRDDTTGVTLQNVDRPYWIQKTSDSIISMADELLKIINEKAEPKQQLIFNKHLIVLSDVPRSGWFIRFRPRKNFLRVAIRGEWTDQIARLKEAGIYAEQGDNPERLRFRLSSAELKKHRELVAAVIHEAVVAQSS